MTGSPPALHIFDCDGVLVDSEVLVTRIESRLLRDIGSHTGPRLVDQLRDAGAHTIAPTAAALFDALVPAA